MAALQAAPMLNQRSQRAIVSPGWKLAQSTGCNCRVVPSADTRPILL
jgi:hypothetical protein